MNGYILSILGVVVAGVIIDVIVPSGTINKYIKSIYSIFLVAVLLMPLINLIDGNKLSFVYKEYELNDDLFNYISNEKVTSLEEEIEQRFKIEGFSNIDIELLFTLNNNKIEYNSCDVNLKNLAISADKQHINKYEFIKEVVASYTNLSYQEIMLNE